MSKDDPDIVATGTRLVYENKWMRVREDAIRRRDGSAGIYGVIEKDDFVVVVPVHEDGSVTMVEQYRYPVGARFWEFCQGMWGGPDADPRLVAAHELAEETGLAAATLTEAGYLYEGYGTMRQGFRVFSRHRPDARCRPARDRGAGPHQSPRPAGRAGPDDARLRDEGQRQRRGLGPPADQGAG